MRVKEILPKTREKRRKFELGKLEALHASHLASLKLLGGNHPLAPPRYLPLPMSIKFKSNVAA